VRGRDGGRDFEESGIEFADNGVFGNIPTIDIYMH
jgi:hypothetical protein